MVYAVDGVAFPVQPDVYMSVSSDQVVTGAQRTVGPGAQMTKELLAEKLTINCKWTLLARDQFLRIKRMRTGKNFVRLKYYDEDTDTVREKQFYSGTMTYEPGPTDASGKPAHYKNCLLYTSDAADD